MYLPVALLKVITALIVTPGGIAAIAVLACLDPVSFKRSPAKYSVRIALFSVVLIGVLIFGFCLLKSLIEQGNSRVYSLVLVSLWLACLGLSLDTALNWAKTRMNGKLKYVHPITVQAD